MFKFIKSENEKARVTEEYVESIERELNIKFPIILKEYYLQHNGANEKECTFKIDGIEEAFCLDTIIPLNYGTFPLEEEYKWVLKNEYISNEHIPLARDMDGDNYYWHSKSGKVYYISHENVENPILICNSVDKFFETLNKSSDEEITIPNLNDNISKNIDSTQYDVQDVKKRDIEKILKYNGKFVTICILTLLTLGIILVVLSQILNELFLIVALAVGVWIPLLVGIDIFARIESKKMLNKYDINEIRKELQAKDAIKLKGIETYITDNYIISNHGRIAITKYSDIYWIYPTKLRGMHSVAAHISAHVVNIFTGSPLRTHLNSGEILVSAIIKNEIQMKAIFNKIYQKNKDVLFGYSIENLEKYEEYYPKDKNKRISRILFVIILIIIGGLIQRYC